jgi:hypothetical protein
MFLLTVYASTDALVIRSFVSIAPVIHFKLLGSIAGYTLKSTGGFRSAIGVFINHV